MGYLFNLGKYANKYTIWVKFYVTSESLDCWPVTVAMIQTTWGCQLITSTWSKYPTTAWPNETKMKLEGRTLFFSMIKNVLCALRRAEPHLINQSNFCPNSIQKSKFPEMWCGIIVLYTLKICFYDGTFWLV